MAEVVVVGLGPAGITAALYVLRGGVPVTVVGKEGSALQKAEGVNNYYGVPSKTTGAQLMQQGIEQAQSMGATIVHEEVVGLGYQNNFLVHTNLQTIETKALVLATGATRKSVNIPGLKDFEGKGVSYCAMCDAFFYRGKDVAVLGCCEFSAHEINDLLPVVKSVTLVTNGEIPTIQLPPEVKVITTPITSLSGGDVLDTVHFEDGTNLVISGLFVAIGIAGSSDFAKKIGAQTQGQSIIIDQNMQTNIPGLFAAGDCTGGLLQVSKAVGEGAKAGISAVKFVRDVKPLNKNI